MYNFSRYLIHQGLVETDKALSVKQKKRSIINSDGNPRATIRADTFLQTAINQSESTPDQHRLRSRFHSLPTILSAPAEKSWPKLNFSFGAG